MDPSDFKEPRFIEYSPRQNEGTRPRFGTSGPFCKRIKQAEESGGGGARPLAVQKAPYSPNLGGGGGQKWSRTWKGFALVEGAERKKKARLDLIINKAMRSGLCGRPGPSTAVTRKGRPKGVFRDKRILSRRKRP